MGHKIKMVIVKIVRMEDQVSVEFEDEWHDNVYWWQEGNAACDCNRHILFTAELEKISKEEACNREFPCSEGKYRVSIRDKATGVSIYDELNNS